MRKLLLAILLGQCCLGLSAHGDSLLLPRGLEQAEGNAGLIDPFGAGAPSRIQLLYSGSEFTTLGPGGAFITELRFRPDRSAGAGKVIVPELQINMSTTPKSPDSMDKFFKNNTGIDDTVVFESGSTQFTYTVDRTHVNSLSLVIPLPKPFFYQPINGNLLVDIQVFQTPVGQGGLARLVLDAQDKNSDSFSILDGSPGNLMGFPASYGVVTEFGFVPVPEPNVFALWCVGWLLTLALRKGCRNVDV